jgi:hypothetical protein
MTGKTWVASTLLVLVLGACGGGGAGDPIDAAAPADAKPPDATPPPDASPADAAPPSGPVGAGALVPAGAASASPNYRFVGTLSAGSPAASPSHRVRTGVVGATQ